MQAHDADGADDVAAVVVGASAPVADSSADAATSPTSGAAAIGAAAGDKARGWLGSLLRRGPRGVEGGGGDDGGGDGGGGGGERPAYQHVRLPEECLRPYLLQHGDRSMAYATFHPSMWHFEAPGLGLVSYVWVRSVLGRVALVVTDPLARRDDLPALLRRFHAAVPGMKQYVAVSQAVADALRAIDARWTATVFANDYYGDFAQWKPPKSRRRYLHEGQHLGLVAEELSDAELTAEERAAVEGISKRWLGSKRGFGSELQLLTYPFHAGDEWMVRKFYCFEPAQAPVAKEETKDSDEDSQPGRAAGRGQLIGFIFFTPCCRGGKVVGYNANILRKDPARGPSFTLDFLLLHCEATFRAEGLEFLSLSFSPLYGLEARPGVDSPLLRRTFWLWFKSPGRLYSKSGLGQHKEHYHMNRVEKVYVCVDGRSTRSALAVQDLILTCTNIVPVARLRHGITG